MKTAEAYRTVGAATVLHFLVDGLCLCALYVMVASRRPTSVVEVFVLYNVLAFTTQPLTGWMADSAADVRGLLRAAVVFLTLGVGFVPLAAWQGGPLPAVTGMAVVAVMLGVGNSLFHVWGARQTVNRAGNDMRALGLFVSVGAFGLAVSMVWSSWSLLGGYLLAIVSLSAYCLHLESDAAPERVRPRRPLGRWATWGAVLALMGFVVFRSFAGTSLSQPQPAWGTGTVLLTGLLVMFGKMSGGWIAMRLGVGQTLLLALAVTGVSLTCRDSAVRLLGLFAINCTMPVTLYLANAVLPGREALAFGLLAAALIPAYLFTIL